MNKCKACNGSGYIDGIVCRHKCSKCHGTGKELKRGTCPECKVKNGYHTETCLTHLNNCFPTPQVSEGKPSDKVTDMNVTWGNLHEDIATLKRRMETLRMDSYNDTFMAVFHRILKRLEAL